MKSLVVALYFFMLCANVFAKSQIPLQDFVKLADVENVEISPSGNKLAMLKRVLSNGERVFVVEITDMNTGKKSYPVVRRKHEFDVYKMIWANDSHILLKIDFFKQLKIENTGTNPKISERRLMVLNLRDNTLKNILNGKSMNRFRSQGWQPQFQDTIIDLLPNDPEHILHAIDWSARQVPQVFRVNLNTLDRKTVQLGRENWQNIMTDRQSNLRVGIHRDIQSGGAVKTRTLYEVNVKDLETKEWSTLATFTAGSPERIWPLGFLSDPDMLLVEALHQGRDAIFKIDLRKPKERSLYYASKTANVGGTLFYSKTSNNPVGYYTTTGIYFWDADYRAFSQGIDKALPSTNNHLKALNINETKYLVYSSSDIDSGTYYLGDRKQKSLNPVAFKYQSLAPENLVSSQRHLVTARDGEKIKVFVTRPKNHNNKALPTIIYANHGRHSAAVGGFDYRTQLWVNRGYAVVQVNFRHGLGNFYNFMQGDVSQWAPNLYQDLADVTKWSVQQGYTDATKTCLFGENYGGYVALMAAAKNEHSFKCIATIGALTDINHHLFKSKSFVSYEQITKRFSSDSSIQSAFSPVSFANTFLPSVLLAHGEDDGMLRAVQSKIMYDALNKYNKNSELILIENEDSKFSTDASRIKVFKAIELFFAAHLQ